MPSQLPYDCFYNIIEFLEEDINTLHTFLFVNRLWCEVAVRILWRNILNDARASRKIINTLFTCLPDESKELLNKNGISISTPTSKSPLFNYASFCRSLSINRIVKMTKYFLKSSELQSPFYESLLRTEILKMLMKQIPFLNKLTYRRGSWLSCPKDVAITHFPGARDCLMGLSELSCSSTVNSEIFLQLSKICHNVKSLSISFIESTPSDGCKKFISSQNNLKYLSLFMSHKISALSYDLISNTNLNTVSKLHLCNYTLLSFVINLTRLEELVLSYVYSNTLADFKTLQYVSFPYLQILKFIDKRPEDETLIKFLEINGKNLKRFHPLDVYR